MVKRYYHRKEFETNEVGQQMTNTGQVDQHTQEEHQPQQAAAVACVLEDSDSRMDDDGIIFHDERCRAVLVDRPSFLLLYIARTYLDVPRILF